MLRSSPGRTWVRRTLVALLLGSAGTAAAIVNGHPVTVVAALVGWGLVGGLLLRATTDPALELFAPALTRTCHPGRVALVFYGRPRRGEVPFGATCFVETPAEAAAVRAEGWEPALVASRRHRRPEELGPDVGWVHVPLLHPGVDTRGGRLVGPSWRGRSGQLARLADVVVATDIVALTPPSPDELDQLLRAWESRGIRAASLTEALESG